MKVWLITISALGLVGSATFVPFVKTTEGATTITNSTVTTRAFFGLEPVTATTTSPLADWCRAHDVEVTEDTVVFSRITQNVWGWIWERGDSQPPASYGFTNDIQKDWLARTPEPDVRRFIDGMQLTDESGRTRLIGAACAQVLGRP